MKRTTKEEVQAWKARWEAVNAFEREELRRTPVAVKVRQLAALMASVHQFGWEGALAAGEEEVRQRWQRLRRAYGVRR